MLTALTAALLASAPPAPVSKADAAAGWKLYSGDNATSLWKGYRQPAFPTQGWSAANGALTHSAAGGGGDLITVDQFGDFELDCEFRTAPKANSGIIWRCTEKHEASWQTGPEFQVIDDAGANVKPDDPHSTGALYDLYTPAPGKTLKPAGEWNSARIRLRTGVLSQYVNGFKTVEARIADDSGAPTKEWLSKIAASKFKDYDGFGVLVRGSIALQDHGDEVAYRNVRIRDLGAPMPGETRLFNGKDLDGWEAIVPELADAKKPQDSVWSVKDGVLVCAGNPAGYIRTKKDFKNFLLKLEWRFSPVTKQAGNSGVLLRMVGQDKVWPKSVEAQLQSGSAGDFWNIDNYVMTVPKERTNGRNTKLTHANEHGVGEWNEYEILVNKGDVVLYVNGEELNRASGVEEAAGKICLQSEGSEIHFRNIRLVELE